MLWCGLLHWLLVCILVQLLEILVDAWKYITCIYLFYMIWVWIYFCCLNFTHWFIPLPLECFFLLRNASQVFGRDSWNMLIHAGRLTYRLLPGPKRTGSSSKHHFFGNYVTIFGGCIFFGHQQNQPKTRYNPWGFSGTSGEASQIPFFSKFSRIEGKHPWTWWFGGITIQNITCDLV